MESVEKLKGKSVEELVEIILQQDADLVAKEKELAGTIKANEDLTVEFEALSKSAAELKAANAKNGPSKETFEVSGTEYGFKKVRIDHNGKVITAEEVLESEQLQEELVKIKSGMIYQKAKSNQ